MTYIRGFIVLFYFIILHHSVSSLEFPVTIAQNQYKNGLSLISFAEKLIESLLENNTRHLIQVKLGEPAQDLMLKISSAICGIWVFNRDRFNRGFNMSASETLTKTKIKENVDDYHGFLVQDTVEFWFYNVKQVMFLVVDDVAGQNKRQTYDGLIGFGYQCKSKSKGNIDLLNIFAKSKGKRNVMSFTLDDETGKGKFYAGEIYGIINIKSKHYRTVRLDMWNYNGHWEVPFHSIYFDNLNVYRINDKLSIGFGGTYFSVKDKFFNYIETNYFEIDIENGICSTLHRKDGYQIVCHKDYNPNKLGTLSFIIDKWNFKIPPEKLFYDTKINGETKKWCAIVHYPMYNEYYISQKLFKNSSVVYDKENNVIGIYEHKD